jgi:ATP-binding cassette subfamily F protein uup
MCQDISKSYGVQTLFEHISFGISKNERLGLIGPNGSGKSTLLRIIAGLSTPDQGEVTVQKHTRLVYLPQDDDLEPDQTIEETILLSLTPREREDTEHFKYVQRMIGQADFDDTSQQVKTLSGGWRKRLAITRAMCHRPDLLLLDEPTNHLDLEGILWLEKMLCQASFGFIVVSHDRAFLQHTTQRIIELGKYYPEGYLSVPGDYFRFEKERNAFLAHQMRKQSVLANKMRREMEWLRRSPKARATKSRFRTEEAWRLKNELDAVKDRNTHHREVKIDFESTERKTRKLITCHDLGKTLADKTLFRHLNLKLFAGMRLGLMGRNGTGKSTLMHMLAGELVPDQGEVEWADDLKVVLFDQAREQLDQSLILRRALAPEGDAVVYRGRSIHVASWARRFLFCPDQLDMPVYRLSGGEQARILIARLMLQPADVLLLDEPTNDLDIPALEVLEESLLNFPGAVVLVTHDRFLLARVADRILGLDGEGRAEMFADYEQWITFLHQQNAMKPKNTEKSKTFSKRKPKNPKKLSYKDQYELDHIEGKIIAAEEELARLQEQLTDETVVNHPERLQEYCRLLQPVQEKVDCLYQRWEELEALREEFG